LAFTAQAACSLRGKIGCATVRMQRLDVFGIGGLIQPLGLV
jgi:hypothetical protein